MHDGALDDALKTQRGLRVDLVFTRKDGCVLVDEVAQFLAQDIKVGRTCAQHLGGSSVVEQRQQQVLDGNKFVPGAAGLDKGHMQADFKFFGDHASSYRSERTNTSINLIL